MRRIAAVVFAAALAGCGGPGAHRDSPAPKAAETPAPKIASFYPAPGRIAKGETAQLCYSVESAKTLALEPAVEKVWPALSRCFEVRPETTTKYTLTASDERGRTDRKSATVEVGAAKPAAKASGRYIIDVTVNKLEVSRGDMVSVCYRAHGATSVRVTPGTAASPLAPDKGCIVDHPTATTTYQVVATGTGGQTDSQPVTVKVR